MLVRASDTGIYWFLSMARGLVPSALREPKAILSHPEVARLIDFEKPVGLLLVAVYRRHFDRQGPASKWLSDNAFGVYLIHPPILIGSAILLHALALNAIAKTLLLTALAAAGSFAVSALVMRKSPLRAIV